MPLENTRRSPCVRELARDEPVAGQEVGEPREVGERRVGGQQQDERGHGLDLVVHEAVAEDAAGDLRHHGLVAAGDHTEVVGQVGDAEEHHHRDHPQPHHDDPGVVRLGRLEGRHAVGHRLHAGERRAASGEGAKEQEEADAFQARRMRRIGRLRQPSRRRLAHAEADHGEDAGDEEIGGQGEDLARLADAAQVGDGDAHDGQQAQPHPVGEQTGKGRGDRVDAGRRRHRHGQHVVDEQGGARQQRGQDAEVVLGHDVGAAPLGIGADRLPVRRHDDQRSARRCPRRSAANSSGPDGRRG